MCLSQTVSFAASGVLLTGGALATARAWQISARYLPVAMMPVFAGLQQFTEGHVWAGLNSGDPAMVLRAALAFIFFTWFMWPVWIPLSVYVLEPAGSTRRPALAIFTVLGFAFGLLLYIPHLLNPDWIEVSVNRSSLAYEGTMFLDYLIPRELTYAIYLFLVIAPPLLSRYLHIRWFAGSIVAVLIIDLLFLRYAYISFFCFLAGLATLHLIYIIVRNGCARECPELFA